MSLHKTYRVVDNDGNSVELPSGTYFCFVCNRKLKTIPVPFTDTIEACDKCGSEMVYTIA